MRDPERIDAVLSELKAFWKAHPDWRLGQIVSNATPDRFRSFGGYGHVWDEIKREDRLQEIPGTKDPFFMEDEDFVEGLRKLPW